MVVQDGSFSFGFCWERVCLSFSLMRVHTAVHTAVEFILWQVIKSIATQGARVCRIRLKKSSRCCLLSRGGGWRTARVGDGVLGDGVGLALVPVPNRCAVARCQGNRIATPARWLLPGVKTVKCHSACTAASPSHRGGQPLSWEEEAFFPADPNPQFRLWVRAKDAQPLECPWRYFCLPFFFSFKRGSQNIQTALSNVVWVSLFRWQSTFAWSFRYYKY